MRAALLIVGLSSGCGSLLGVHDFAGAAADAPAPDDAAIDATRATCVDRWIDGSVAFSSPVALTSIAADNGKVDRDPAFSLDGKTLYWSTDRSGKSYDVWSVGLGADGMPIGPGAKLSAWTSDAVDETKATFADGGLDTILAAKSTQGPPSQFGESLRQAASDPDDFKTSGLAAIDNGIDSVFDPAFAAGGGALYYAFARAGAGSEILRSSRVAPGASWDSGASVLGVHQVGDLDADPAVSDDERLLVFSSNRSGATGPSGLFYATRAGASVAFGAYLHLATLDGAKRESDPALSPDACTLVFASDRDTSDTIYRLYLTRVTP